MPHSVCEFGPAKPAAPLEPLAARVLRALLLFLEGVANGAALHRPARALWSDALLRGLVARCLAANGVVFLGSLFVFDRVIEPALAAVLGPRPVLPPVLFSIAYKVLWLYPVYLFCFVASSSWHAQIADRAFTFRYGASKNSVSIGGLAESVYKVLIYCACVVETFVLDEAVPFVGPVVAFALTSWVYSLLCIDAKWTLKTSWRFPKRMEEFQRRWAFFLGFGTPFTLTCYFFPLLVNCGVYAILFPIFEIIAVMTDERRRETPPLGPLYKAETGCGSLAIFRPSTRLVDLCKRGVVALLSPSHKAEQAAQQQSAQPESHVD
eukprot:m51a1_g7207 hypothetical protein (322) ;mRNA; f:220559-222133